MKIKSIRISNILSFEQKDDIDQCQEIVFNEKLNIIIGPNGSGKSNFLEIINHVFRNSLFKSYQYNQTMIQDYKTKVNINLRNTITFQDRVFNIVPNRNSKNNEQKIKLKITLSDDDKQNMVFIHKYKDKINEFIKKYVDQDIVFETVSETEILNCKQIEFTFNKKTNQTVMEIDQLKTPIENYVLKYLQNFNMLQNIILVANYEEGEKWQILKNTFALISGYRNYNAVTLNFSLQPDKQNHLQSQKLQFLNETTRTTSNDEPFVFPYVTTKIGYSYHEERDSKGTKSGNLVDNLQDKTFTDINVSLKNIMKMHLDIKRDNIYTTGGTFRFISDETGDVINPAELSAGEKGIIHFIFCIHGYEIKNGVMIIDEPELHLHPQLQQKYLEMLKQTEKDEKIQFIIATHSPTFITPETIEGVLRFGMENNFTKVTNPEINTDDKILDDKDLVRILNYTNNAKVFFAKKVLMVEGETDEYFFQTFLKKYKPNNSSRGIEFLDIRGTTNYNVWKTFLGKCGIKSYFIGDLDVILSEQLGIINKTTKDTLSNDFHQDPTTQQKIVNDSSYLQNSKKDFINFIKNHNEWHNISSKLSQMESDGIFILKNGELEDYIGHNVKGKLQNVVEFCKNKFETWYASDAKVVEIQNIFSKIV